MPTSNILLEQPTSAQLQKVPSYNESLERLDLTITDLFAIVMTDADRTLSEVEMRHALGDTGGVTLTADRDLNFPSTIQKLYFLRDSTVGGFAVTAQVTGGGGTGVVLPKGKWVLVHTDGTDVIVIDPSTFGRKSYYYGWPNANFSGDQYINMVGQLLTSATVGYVATRNGDLVSIAVQVNVQVESTPGTIDFEFRQDGTLVGLLQLTSVGTGLLSGSTTFKLGANPYTAGDILSMFVNLNTFIGTLNSIIAEVEIGDELV